LKDRIFTIQELINEEFLFLWKVPNLKWNIKNIGNKQDIGSTIFSVFSLFKNNNYIYFIENVLKHVIEILNNLEVDNKNVGFFKINISQKIQSDDKLLKIFKFNKLMKILRLSLTNLEVY
jgi:hypothetical protein